MNQGKRREILLAFSWCTNGKLLLKTNSSASMLNSLHGIRFLSITWIVIGHAYGTAFYLPGDNMFNLSKYVSSACLIIFNT